MENSRLRRGEEVDIRFLTWHRQWMREHPRCRIWTSNVAVSSIDDAPLADLRGEMGELRLPIEANDRLQIVIVPLSANMR